MKFDYGIDEKGKKFIILKHKGRFLIFKETSKLLEYISKNKASHKQLMKAIDYVSSVFKTKRETYIERMIKNIKENQDLKYIG